MREAPIWFAFPDSRAANLALETLTELGYHAHAAEREGKPAVWVVVEDNDLTSALEIAQACGGSLLDTDSETPESAVFNQAYDMDTVRIPAHLVNEDEPDAHVPGDADIGIGTVGSADDDGAAFDPSGDDYDHISAGVRL